MLFPARRHKLITGFTLIVLAAATRLLPHPANFTAVSAVALLSGAYLGMRWAAAVTVAAMLISDVFLGFYHWPVMISVYSALLLAGAIGRWVGRNVRWGRILGGSLAGSVLFFLATNWAVWQFTPMYPKSWSGLIASYLAALPFFRNSVLGDLTYSGVLFSAAYLLTARVRQNIPAPRPRTSPDAVPLVSPLTR